MNRFFNFFFMVVLALLPFSLASCSDNDDDAAGEGNGSDFVEITFNGKTYRGNIPAWGYAILDNDRTDQAGKSISITNVIIDNFSTKHGFFFMPGIAHYAQKSDLLNAKPGMYPHRCEFNSLGQWDTSCENFTLVTNLESADHNDFFELQNGTHQVKSIKEVGGKVQVEGVFDGIYKNDNASQYNIRGKYRMTLSVH